LADPERQLRVPIAISSVRFGLTGQPPYADPCARLKVVGAVTFMTRFDNPWQITWNLIASFVAIYSVVRVAVIPAAVFKNGWRTKIFWLLATGAVFASVAGYYIPVGPVWVIFEMKRRFRVVTRYVDSH
jgi:hypothetical protein